MRTFEFRGPDPQNAFSALPNDVPEPPRFLLSWVGVLAFRGVLALREGAARGDSGVREIATPETNSWGGCHHGTFEHGVQGGQEGQPLVSGEMSAEASLSEKVNGCGNVRLCSQLKQRLGCKEGEHRFKSQKCCFHLSSVHSRA